MRSALYEGTIRHRRFAVRERVFRHRLALAYVDLDELPRLFGGRLIARRPGIVRFRRADYLGDPAVPLAADVRALVAGGRGPTRAAPCGSSPSRGRSGTASTRSASTTASGRGRAPRAPSSPRSRTRRGATATRTCFRARRRPRARRRGRQGAPRLAVHGDGPALHVAGDPRPARRSRCTSRAPSTARRAFDATLSLRRTPLTRRSLARVCLRYPAATLRVLALIYGHAAVLWLRRVPVHPRPAADGR